MGPLARTLEWSATTLYIVTFIMGVGFGATLEMAGFGDSRKLTGQFYLRDMTVLKVMFGAVIEAAVLLGLFGAFGLIDMSQVWVNPTYLWPGIVGGLVMGFGFLLGGFCPGTSLVAAATLKIDGIVFVIGAAIGIFLFGLTLPLFEGFWLSSDYGRLTLPEVFGVSRGVVLVLVVVMGLFSFMLAELSEAKFGRGERGRFLHVLPRRTLSRVAVGALAVGALVGAFKGEPTAQDLWKRVAPEKTERLESRAVHVHPQEVAEVSRNTELYTVVLDVRPEEDYNLFHLRHSMNVTMDQLADEAFVKKLATRPENTIFFTVSWDETASTEAWKLLVARGLANVYIVEGGINKWHDLFPPPKCLAVKRTGVQHREETPAYTYLKAVGDCCNTAYPEIAYKQIPTDCYLEMTGDPSIRSKSGSKHAAPPDVKFEHKVELKKKRAVTGGCG